MSGKGSVSPATMEKVRKAIDELEFRPSHAARSLLSGTTRMIGVYIPCLGGTFFSPILQALDAQLRAGGLHMVVAFGVGSGDARRQAIDGIEFLLGRGCDGLLVMSNALTGADVAALGPRRNRIVILNHHLDELAEQCFMPDHVKGGALAAQHLLGQGHRHFAVIAGPQDAADNVARVDSFLAELARAGVDPSSIWRGEGGFSAAGGAAAAQALRASGHPATALFCANDEMAVGALSYFQQAGVRVPEQISVIGYDNTPSCDFSAPPLTTVHVPWCDLALNGLNQLLNRCYSAVHPVERAFEVAVMERASVAPPAAMVRKAA